MILPVRQFAVYRLHVHLLYLLPVLPVRPVAFSAGGLTRCYRGAMLYLGKSELQENCTITNALLAVWGIRQTRRSTMAQRRGYPNDHTCDSKLNLILVSATKFYTNLVLNLEFLSVSFSHLHMMNEDYKI